MTNTRRILWPTGGGLAGGAFLTILFGIESWTESPRHALDFFWEQRWIVVPLILGFGVQAALYTVLMKRQFLPVAAPGSSGARTGASGAASTLVMEACCAHHVADVLPVQGLTAAAAFRATAKALACWELEDAPRIRMSYGPVLVGLEARMLLQGMGL